MAEADVATVAAIEASVQDFPWTENLFAQSLKDQHSAWVMEKTGEIVGFAVSMQVLDEASLLTIGVRPDHQRQGLGRRLVEAVFDHAAAHGAAVLFLEVRQSNKGARTLYRRMGFVETGVRKGYYRALDGREDAILMALTVDEGGR
ncbi:MAG: ribosomal protein S18-alanine N-acetyltransferase [Burkholderiales bacterium]|nr:ribosomal protein S18-alanine N-acetyltransferase [Burkholderiales bacterium]